MALDAAMLGLLARELNGELSGLRVDKLYMPARDEAVLQMRGEHGQKRLLISARPGSARVQITDEEFENPASPPAFCMLLRKHIQSARLTGVRAAEGERVLFLDFDTVDELFDRTVVTLSVELMGRYSNIVVVSAAGRVIDAMKRIDADMSDKRQLLPGIEFTMPPTQDKLSFFTAPIEDVVKRVCRSSRPLSAALLDALAGVGPVVCREMARRVGNDPEADSLDAAGQAALSDELARVRAAAEGQGTELSIVYDGGRAVEFSFIALDQYEGCERLRFESVSALLERYYAERDRAERARARSHDLKKQLDTLIERTERRQSSRMAERDRSDEAEQKKLRGELITANLHLLQKGQRSAKLLNYYTGELLDIALDPRLTPGANAQRYYRDYRKLTTAQKVLTRLLEEGTLELEYLRSVRYEIDRASVEEEFILIRRELKEAGYLRGYRPPAGKTRKVNEQLSYRTSAGLLVLAGRNNRANDRLTFKTAGRRDMWFHVKNAPGSHTILFCEGTEPDDQSLTEAAEIAAFNSALSAGELVPVDYTEVRNVKKPPEAKAGMVIYNTYKTAFVTPSAQRVAGLASKEEKRR